METFWSPVYEILPVKVRMFPNLQCTPQCQRRIPQAILTFKSGVAFLVLQGMLYTSNIWNL